MNKTLEMIESLKEEQADMRAELNNSLMAPEDKEEFLERYKRNAQCLEGLAQDLIC